LAGGVDASYAIAGGKTTVVISSKDFLKHRAVYVGTGQMIFHWVQEGKTQAWRCDVSMVDPAAVQVEESTGTNGNQQLEVELGEVYPAGCLLQGRMVGALVAPAIHVDVPFGSDVWVFLIRSPWFPLKLQIDRPVLIAEHDTSRVTASLSALGDGSLNAQVAVDGTDFKSASLVVKRSLGSYSSDEVVCEVGTGTQTSAWKPIVRVFDLLLVTKGIISESHLADVVRDLGGQISSGVFGAGSVEGDFVLCDGPAMSYTWLLKGHRGFMENVEDQTDAKFTW
jgi:hypothetical protein